MSLLASNLVAWPMLALAVAAFLLARRLAARSRWPAAPRLRVLVRELAGPVACVLLVIPFALVGGAIFGVPTPVDEVVLSNVTPWLPAGQAGLAIGDKLLSMNGQPVHSIEQIHAEVVAGEGQALTFELERGGARQSLTVQPVQQAGHWMLGIASLPYRADRSLTAVIGASVRLPVESLASLAITLRDALIGRREETLSGPVAVLSQSNDEPSQRLFFLLSVLASVSIELGLIAELAAIVIALVRSIRARRNSQQG